ncbi:uncharacterized protein LOC118268572 isoform X6 [Spodoptera frugiperda]|uniref:Uncharacterized protein LOC118268572 isoform X6 n=1 Tax=Spodoptera frugiperda TaxID=7108 RepID=A0A9R0F170_SPOFR|nr:uncharacterized protein LOC118268572 isoform X6 [Spodoptera frugiperda]
MSQKTFNKCYFGCSCNDNDPLHKFPNPNSLKLEQIDRFKQWKSVLKPADQEKGDDYICKKIRICGRHFNKSYRLPSHYLTQNAVPTLFLGHSMNAEVDIYSDPTPGPSNLTDVVSDYVEPAPIYCTPEKRRSMSYMKHEILPSECQQTADFLLIFDQLFDSFNGHSYQISSKKYKSCFKTNSPHIQLWNNLLPVLESIKFQSITHNNQGNVVKFESIPSIKNWINNIKTFKEMWVDLNTNHNVNSLLTRNFNQDPLENFFSSIRSNGIRNTNPSCNQFINAYKTLIINNFNSPHSLNANCEKDNNYLFQSLNHLINTPACTSSNDDFACEVDSLITVMGNIKSNVNNVVHDESKKYVTGYIIKKCKIKVFRNCEICMRDFCSSTINKQSFNYEIDYTKKSLFYPNKKFNELMNEIYYLIVACLRISPESLRLKDKMKFLLNCACDYNMITCDLHKSQLIEFINDLSIKLIIHSWCTNVNRILNGKITNFDKDDHIKLKAFNYFEKHKKNKK